MKQLFKDLKNYSSAATRPPVRQTSAFHMIMLYAMLVAFVIIEEMAFSSSSLYSDDSVTVFLAPTLMPILAVHICLHAVKYKPTLAGVIPVNYKRRVLHDIFYPIIASILMFIALIIFFLIIVGIVWLVSPESVIAEDEEVVSYGLGTLAVFFRFLFAYGCNIIIACQKKTKPKTILTAVFLIVYWAATLLTGYAINGFNSEAGASAMYTAEFNNMKYPWIGYMSWAIAGIAAMTAAVISLIKFEKPKEF